jgi:hypothetical protein
MAPVLVFRLKSGGNAPLARLYVVVPNTPAAATLPAYAVPTDPAGSAGENVINGAVMVMVMGDEVVVRAVAVPESVILKMMLL